jgi:hypothetical protein
MYEFDFLTMMTVVLLGLHLLHQVSQKIPLNRWLAPFSIGWVLTGLLWLMPFAEGGSKGAIAVSYLLIGTLIFNTLVLYLCSRLPNCFVPLKSVEIEMVGNTLLKLLGKGFSVVGRSLLCALFEWIDEILDTRQSRLARLNAF